MLSLRDKVKMKSSIFRGAKLKLYDKLAKGKISKEELTLKLNQLQITWKCKISNEIAKIL